MKSQMKVCFYKYNKNMYYFIVSCETEFESTISHVSLFNSSRSIKNAKDKLKSGNMHIVYKRSRHTKWTEKIVTCSCANADFLVLYKKFRKI